MAILKRPDLKLYMDAGTVVTCPECKAEIAVLKEPLRMGELIDAKKFSMVQEGHKPNSPMNCTECNTPFASRIGGIHTSTGWMPPPLLETPFRG